MGAPVIDASSSAQDVTFATSTLTISHTCSAAANVILLVGAMAASSGASVTVSGVTYNSVSMGAAQWSASDANFCRAYGFKLASPASGANNIVITYSGFSTALIGGGTSFTQAAGTVGTGVTKGNTADDPISVVVTDATSNDVVWGAICSDAITATENNTLSWERENVATDVFAGAQYAAGSASVTMEWNLNAAAGGALGAMRVLGTAGADLLMGQIWQ